MADPNGFTDLDGLYLLEDVKASSPCKQDVKASCTQQAKFIADGMEYFIARYASKKSDFKYLHYLFDECMKLEAINPTDPSKYMTQLTHFHQGFWDTTKEIGFREEHVKESFYSRPAGWKSTRKNQKG